MVKALYFSSPLKEEIIGTEKSLQSIHLSSVKKFYEQYYSVENLTFFAVGDFDPQEVVKLLNKAGLPSFKKLPVKKYQTMRNMTRLLSHILKSILQMVRLIWVWESNFLVDKNSMKIRG